MSSTVETVLARELEKDRREARRTARLRCRARELRETAEFATDLIEEAASTEALPPSKAARIELRPVSPLELGLMYAWMAADEAEFSNKSDTPDAQRVTCWWSGGATGIQCTWEAATGWFDEELDAKPAAGGSVVGAPVADTPFGHTRGAATASIARLRHAIEVGSHVVARRHLGPTAASASERSASTAARAAGAGAEDRRPHFLGAFVAGERAPVGFVATKEPPSRSYDAYDEWAIDAMGTRVAWRGKGVGTRLAKHCIEQATARARTAASKGPRDVAADASHEYRIDVVPSAVAFWVRLGFIEVEATGEQAYMMSKGGDRPMVKQLDLA